MKNHNLIIILILTTLALLTTGCQKEQGFDYAELVDGETFNKFIPATARSVVFEYNEFTTGKRITLSTPTSPVPIYGHLDSTVWHVTTTASTIYANPHCAKMFYNRSKLKSIEFGSGFNTSNVTDMRGMFQGCSKLTNLNLSSFNTSNVNSMAAMFKGCSGLTSLDVSSFNTSNVTDMHEMFRGCNKLTSLNVSSFNTSNVQRMDAMFYGCSGLTSLDVSSFNTSNVIYMSRAVDSVFYENAPDGHPFATHNQYMLLGMFAGCSSLTSLDLSNFNTSKVTDMRGLFAGCKNLTYLNVSSFNTSNVQHMDAMFKGCSSLTSLDLSNFNTSNVVSMGYYVRVFSNSGSWGQLQHSGYDWDGGMFMNCSGLTSLNLSSFNTSKVTNMCKMFCNCKQLTFLDLSNFDMTLVDRNKKLDMCSGLSTTSRACTIVCTESVQNSLLEYYQYIAQYEEDEDVFYYYTDIPVDEVTFTWVRP